jgi:hypothetical protein
LFGASGGGNAGCIGCVCVNPTVKRSFSKGSAYTSPTDNKPQGDTFDIDFVAHEMGHQLGTNHTFSHIENTQELVSQEVVLPLWVMLESRMTTMFKLQMIIFHI